MESITVRCFACKVGMKIKSEYAGKLRKCPKCGEIFIVPQSDGNAIVPPPQVLEKLRQAEQASAQSEVQTSSTAGTQANQPQANISPLDDERITPVDHPKRLNPKYRYMILDTRSVIACWQLDKGWQVWDGARLVPAKRNQNLLPKQGEFYLVELQLEAAGDEMKLTKIRIFRLARQYSVSKLAGDDFAVLSTIVAASGLLRPQKSALLAGLKQHFMREVWAEAKNIYDYLLNDDSHSTEVE
ncbi:MAG: hypothetical protein Q4D38_02360 [Planctomycetia bacterium]|nr:hypothetical protein [Planctomycetia bacterium]